MKILSKTLDMRVRGHVVGCGVQGSDCLALDLSEGKGGKWSINWSLAGSIDDPMFAKALSRKTGSRHFWVSPSEEGGLQVETTKAIDTLGGKIDRTTREGYFTTQIKTGFVNEKIVLGGICMHHPSANSEEVVDHNVGGGAIRDNIKRDYRHWYSEMRVRRPHIASTSLALANAYLALYPEDQRLANPLRLVVLKGRSVYRAILMDDWRYLDEVLLPRMEGDDISREVIEARINGWIASLRAQHPGVDEKHPIEPLVVSVRENAVSAYEHWDLWGEYAMEKIDMTGEVAQAILENRDIAPVAFGMALQGGC